MNLLQRLKPEYKEILESENIKYPSLTGYVVNELEAQQFVRELKYGVVMDLKFLLNVDIEIASIFD